MRAVYGLACQSPFIRPAGKMFDVRFRTRRGPWAAKFLSGLMKVKVFTINFDPVAGVMDDINLQDFCETHSVVSVQSNFFQMNARPMLILCLGYSDVEVKPEAGFEPDRNVVHPKEKRKHPKADLDLQQQALYELLRNWRNQTAIARGVPPYLVMDNRQISDICRICPTTLSAFEQIKGLGAGRSNSYGKEIIEIIRQFGSELTIGGGQDDGQNDGK